MAHYQSLYIANSYQNVTFPRVVEDVFYVGALMFPVKVECTLKRLECIALGVLIILARC